MLQEARNTLRTLQHERELAERIEQSIKQLRITYQRAGRREANGVEAAVSISSDEVC